MIMRHVIFYTVAEVTTSQRSGRENFACAIQHYALVLTLLVNFDVRKKEGTFQARTKREKEKQTTIEKIRGKAPRHVEQAALMRMTLKLC